MTLLSVNINKVATLRNARGQNTPDLIEVAKDIERFGANGITVHPRPDERHIRYSDVEDLSSVLTTEFNVEGYPNKLFIDLVKKLANSSDFGADPSGVLTSNAGWNTIENMGLLTEVLSDLKNEGIRTSVFVSTDMKFIEGAKYAGADR